LNTKPDISSVIKVELVEQGISKLSYFDPSDVHGTNVKEKYVNLEFHLDTIMNNINNVRPINMDSFTAKTCLLKITMKKHHLPLQSVRMMYIRQTTQLAKSIIHYPMRHRLKVGFK
jgi:hypothetical protein